MIRVQPQPEPETFDELVRQPGLRILKDASDGKVDWDDQANCLWGRCALDLRRAYGEICCYTGLRVMPSEVRNQRRSLSVEHFIPKSERPDLAFEWSNYRLSSQRANERRGNRKVLDPFEVENGWFRLDLLSGRLSPSKGLSEDLTKEVETTIRRIGLNEPLWTEARMDYYAAYLKLCGVLPEAEAREYLRLNAPIVLEALSAEAA